MTIRTFWTIFIKILGIWLVLGSISIISQFLAALPFFGRNNDENIVAIGIAFGLLLLTIGIYVFILQLFVFKTAWLIDKLHLDKGFEEDKLDLNIQLSTILTIATIVVGGIIFIDGLPHLCSQVFTFLKEEYLFIEVRTSTWIIFYLVKTIIGYVLMTNSKSVVKFIERQTAKQNNEAE